MSNLIYDLGAIARETQIASMNNHNNQHNQPLHNKPLQRADALVENICKIAISRKDTILEAVKNGKNKYRLYCLAGEPEMSSETMAYIYVKGKVIEKMKEIFGSAASVHVESVKEKDWVSWSYDQDGGCTNSKIVSDGGYYNKTYRPYLFLTWDNKAKL